MMGILKKNYTIIALYWENYLNMLKKLRLTMSMARTIDNISSL